MYEIPRKFIKVINAFYDYFQTQTMHKGKKQGKWILYCSYLQTESLKNDKVQDYKFIGHTLREDGNGITSQAIECQPTFKRNRGKLHENIERNEEVVKKGKDL